MISGLHILIWDDTLLAHIKPPYPKTRGSIVVGCIIILKQKNPNVQVIQEEVVSLVRQLICLNFAIKKTYTYYEHK